MAVVQKDAVTLLSGFVESTGRIRENHERRMRKAILRQRGVHDDHQGQTMYSREVLQDYHNLPVLDLGEGYNQNPDGTFPLIIGFAELG